MIHWFHSCSLEGYYYIISYPKLDKGRQEIFTGLDGAWLVEYKDYLIVFSIHERWLHVIDHWCWSILPYRYAVASGTLDPDCLSSGEKKSGYEFKQRHNVETHQFWTMKWTSAKRTLGSCCLLQYLFFTSTCILIALKCVCMTNSRAYLIQENKQLVKKTVTLWWIFTDFHIKSWVYRKHDWALYVWMIATKLCAKHNWTIQRKIHNDNNLERKCCLLYLCTYSGCCLYTVEKL